MPGTGGLYHALLPVIAMKRVIIAGAALCLSGCINVYGPVKPAGPSTTDSPPASATSDAASSELITNRKPDELFDAALSYLRQKGVSPQTQDAQTGVIAALGDDAELAGLWLDCSSLSQQTNIQRQYRIIASVASAGEGARVTLLVSGVAGLVAADGNDKVKPAECQSSGVLEKDLLEQLRK